MILLDTKVLIDAREQTSPCRRWAEEVIAGGLSADFIWGAQAASLQHPATSPNAFLREAHALRFTCAAGESFARSCRERQAGSLCSPETKPVRTQS
jgi:hypothetical protein